MALTDARLRLTRASLTISLIVSYPFRMRTPIRTSDIIYISLMTYIPPPNAPPHGKEAVPVQKKTDNYTKQNFLL